MADKRLFHWRGMDSEGHFSQGAFFCLSRHEAMERLVEKNCLPTTLVAGRRYQAKDWKCPHKTAFFRQLATLLKAGLTLSDSLTLTGEDHDELAWQALITHIQQSVSEGVPFSDAMAEWPDVFPPLYPALIKVGELTGRLDECCLQLASQQERQQALQKKVQKALRYPLFILAVALIVSTGMLVWVLPEFVSIYQTFDAPLPAFTAAVMTLSDWLRQYGLFILPGVIAAGYSVQWHFHRSASWQRKIQLTLLRIPLIGRLYRGGQLGRIFMTLAMTQQAGLTLLQSLQAVERTLTQKLWRDAIVMLQTHISSGRPLNHALKQHVLFTPLCYQLIKVGEEAGSLDSLLVRLGVFHEENTAELADNLAAALEPLMMIVTGAIVGTLVVAMYLPIFNLGDALG
ncbi:protein transport protein HofC [Erwinia oleae]|uniref:protein transport protein HofC n=1 Tax=Erwinia oleae TaxID=796334 RepID=UPI00054E6605|nr:protein transport protein HofC [Erwinia oleae]